MRPAILGIRISVLFHLYLRRLRSHTVQELLAGSGIAVGVALVLGVLLANASLLGSTEQTVHGVIGAARLELAARSNNGFDEQLANRVRLLPGVQAAASVLQESATVIGPKGRVSVRLVGVTPALVTLGGAITRDVGAGPALIGGGVGLPLGVARTIGVRPEHVARLLDGGQAHLVRVRAVLGAETIGPVAESPLTLALLGYAQRLAGRPGRVTQVYVQPRAGADREVARELRGLAAGRLDVVPADNELRLLRAIAQPNNQATTMFALIGAMVGFLLTFNAMLLTVPERRRYIADLRMQGYDWRQALLIIGFEALALGLVASVAGIALGYVLSHTLFHRVPVYLAFAFPVGSQQVIQVSLVLFAFGCGVLATLLASLVPVFDLRPGRTRDAVLRQAGGAGEGIGKRTAKGFGMVGLLMVVIATALVLIAPNLTLAGGATLALATLCLIPVAFTGAAQVLRRASEHIPSSALVLAVRELRTTSMPLVALAGVGALAIYGSVAIGGARHDLLSGLDANFREYLGTADVWVTTGGNDLTTNSFQAPGLQAKLAKAAGVSSARVYQGELMDVGTRRVWVIARPPGDGTMIPASQLLEGELAHGNELLRGSGWAAVSTSFAVEHHLRVGNTFTLPTPSGTRSFGVAAITTNVGWPPGALIVNTNDYRRYWLTSEPSALEVNFQPDVSPSVGLRSIDRVLAGYPGLSAQTRQAREVQYAANSREALQSLGEISTLLLIAAALAVASALSATIWQRRALLASLKIQGYDRHQLWRGLLLESMIVLGFGCLIGAVLGIYGHVLASRWLKLTTGFSAPFSLRVPSVLLDIGLVAGIGLIVIALPGFLAARVSSRAALQE
ncbi:MAG TPA: FtsX-like permease family protein [Solirubrobacteraceae bacterium]|jgi:putative ABC transport system permease protein|nr:FtsX-like permease family protein [Solirubrobacteraceae bacterium]